MTEARRLSQRFCHCVRHVVLIGLKRYRVGMRHESMMPWGVLGRWRGRALALAGGLFLASPVAKAMIRLTPGSPSEWLVAVLVFTGLLAALVGLLGFYPRLTERVPRHAVAGLVSTVFAAVVTVCVSIWVLAATVLPALSSVTLSTPPRAVFLVFVAALGVAFAVVGAASLRVSTIPRRVGFLLLLLAVPWGFLLVSGSSLPTWALLSTYGVIPVGLFATAYTVQAESTMVGSEVGSADVLGVESD